MQRLLFPLLIICGSASAFAQTTAFAGQIVDEDRAPLIGVSVRVNGQPTGDVTDSNGHFQISAKPEDRIEFSYAGALSVAYTIPELAMEYDSTVVLESAVELPECVITAAKGQRGRPDTIVCFAAKMPDLSSSSSDGHTIFDSSFPQTAPPTDKAWQYAPNPTRDAVTVQTEMATGHLLVYALNGCAVARVSVTAAITRIELAGYAAGTYFLYFENAGRIEPVGKVAVVKE